LCQQGERESTSTSICAAPLAFVSNVFVSAQLQVQEYLHCVDVDERTFLGHDPQTTTHSTTRNLAIGYR